MLNDVIEAEASIAYHDEGVRLSKLSFPSLMPSKSYKPKLWLFKQGGLWFARIGPFRLSFCKVRN